MAHPWSVFKAAGYTVDLVSVAGGRPPLDGVDLNDPIQSAFSDGPDRSQKLAHTMAPSDIHPADYDAILFAGGAKHTGAPNFQPYVVTDERLVTGQNPASAIGVAEAVVDALRGN